MCTIVIGLTGAGAARGQSPAQVSATVSERELASAAASLETTVECEDGSSAIVSTSITVSPRAESSRGSGGASESTSLWLDWFELDGCEGQLSHTGRIIDAPDSEHDGLRSASVAGVFELVDVTLPVGTVTLELEWQGTGGVTSTSLRDSQERDGSTVVTWQAERRRPAVVTGFVTLNDVELPLSGQGELVQSHTLEVVLPR
jgi:hypothetical protein